MIDGVALRPGVLVKGLDDVVGLVGWGSEGLAQSEGKDEFAVSQVGDDVADAPFAGRGWVINLCAGETSGEGVKSFGGAGKDGDGVVAVKIFCVGV